MQFFKYYEPQFWNNSENCDWEQDFLLLFFKRQSTVITQCKEWLQVGGSRTLRQCGTSINWDITRIARGAKTQIWWSQEQRTFTVDLTLSRHGFLVAGEELPATQPTRLSERIRALSKHPDIMCTFMHVWHPPHGHTRTHTQMFLNSTKSLDEKKRHTFFLQKLKVNCYSTFIVTTRQIPSTKTLPEKAMHCVAMKRNEKL